MAWSPRKRGASGAPENDTGFPPRFRGDQRLRGMTNNVEHRARLISAQAGICCPDYSWQGVGTQTQLIVVHLQYQHVGLGFVTTGLVAFLCTRAGDLVT